MRQLRITSEDQIDSNAIDIARQYLTELDSNSNFTDEEIVDGLKRTLETSKEVFLQV